MNPLRRIFGRIGSDESRNPVDLDKKQRERLEARLREGARALSTQGPPGLHDRIMDRVRRATRTRPAAPADKAPFHRRPRSIAVLATIVAAGTLALLYPSLQSPSEMPAPPSFASIHRQVFTRIAPVFQMPATLDGELEAEAENALLDGSRAARKIVSILPSSLRARFDRH